MSILRSSTTAEETPNDKGEAYATDFLNGYTSDFFHATVGRWDELSARYWRQFWTGF